MVRRTEKSIKKLSRNRWWLTIPIVIFLSICTYQLLVVSMRGLIYYIMEKSLEEDYLRASDLMEMYEYAEKNNDISVKKFLGLNEREWFVTDREGTILDGDPENTCGENSAVLTKMDFISEITVHEDLESDVLYISNGGLAIRYKKLFKEIDHSFEETPETELPDEMKDLSEEELDEHDLMLVSRNLEDRASFPVWAEIPMQDGRIFMAKIFFRVDAGDLTVVVIAVAVLFLFLFILFVYLVIRTIRLRRKQKKLTLLYHTDEITGGYNWKWMHAAGERYLKKKKTAKMNFAMLDIDFDQYRNYCICHTVEEGEKLLEKLDEVIGNNIAKKEMSAHYGSASFAVLLRYDREEELLERVKALIGSLEQAAPGQRVRFHVGIDLIPASLNENGRAVKRKKVDLETLYNNANAARMTLESKAESAVQIFDSGLVEEQKWNLSVQENQEKALRAEEFVVYYQPKYDPRTNMLSGAEALIRWNSPELGFVSPGRFIPIFENNGFITEIDHYMIRHVAADQKKWLDQGYHLVPVSVNVSRAHFAENDLAEQIRDMVDEAGTPHRYIEIELTESAFFDDKKALVSTIRKLKKYGFTVSMDDFGSGYSSLNSLKDMPLDVLKLDAEFFRGDVEDSRGEIVVSEAIRLAKSLHMRTVAEGVEIKKQVDFLADQGCDMIQGYYYAKPMPGEEYEVRMKTGFKDPEAEKMNEEMDRKMEEAGQSGEQAGESI